VSGQAGNPPSDSGPVIAAVASLMTVPQRLTAVEQQLAAVRDELGAVLKRLPPSLVSLKEAAQHLGVSVATLRRQAKSGRVATVRMGSRLLVDLARITAADATDVAGEAQLARVLPIRRRKDNP
jgi:excisionase family DNA binding protein